MSTLDWTQASGNHRNASKSSRPDSTTPTTASPSAAATSPPAALNGSSSPVPDIVNSYVSESMALIGDELKLSGAYSVRSNDASRVSSR